MDLVFAHVLQAPVVGAMAVMHPGHEHVVLGWIGLQPVLADSRHGWIGLSCGVKVLLELVLLLGIQALVGLTALLFFLWAEFGHVLFFR